jgi:hypothetical protein
MNRQPPRHEPRRDVAFAYGVAGLNCGAAMMNDALSDLLLFGPEMLTQPVRDEPERVETVRL